jgi:hypothetical protein
MVVTAALGRGTVVPRLARRRRCVAVEAEDGMRVSI